MNNWAKDLAKILYGLDQERIEKILLVEALPKPWKSYPKKRASGNQEFSQEELYLLHEKIQKYSMPEPMSGCWIWIGGVDWDGYGATGFYNKNIKAHRASYLIFKGDIPAGMSVCHSCDNPYCCNPEHLWIGTTKENQIDSFKKLRRQGELSGSSKYTNKTVSEIRERVSNGETRKSVSKSMRIPKSTLDKICSKRTWSHI